MNDKMHIIGDIRFADNAIGAKQAEEVIQSLQHIMNHYGVVKIDIAVNPWKKGPMKVKPKGPRINLN